MCMLGLTAGGEAASVTASGWHQGLLVGCMIMSNLWTHDAHQ
jgi:hypothetical protein